MVRTDGYHGNVPWGEGGTRSQLTRMCVSKGKEQLVLFQLQVSEMRKMIFYMGVTFATSLNKGDTFPQGSSVIFCWNINFHVPC